MQIRLKVAQIFRGSKKPNKNISGGATDYDWVQVNKNLLFEHKLHPTLKRRL